MNERDVIKAFKADPIIRLHTTSENAIGWIEKHLNFTHLPEKICLFKDKFAFRELTGDLFPDLFYKKVQYEELDNLKPDQLPFPFIIKPNIGFFSMGVHKVLNPDHWPAIKDKIKNEVKEVQAVYPTSVLNTASFIIEECIEGDEYAFDAYFDEDGEAVLLGVMKHVFSGAEDVSDRLYMTSRSIVKGQLEAIDELLGHIGQKAFLRNFSLHVEVRLDTKGRPVPIEVNPLRFGAWCTSADLAHYAFGFNPYHYYIAGLKPDWEDIFSSNSDDIYSIVILDNSTGYTADQIKSFDYDKFLASFENPLELRKIDYHRYPMFAILFVRSRRENYKEVDDILRSDLREFVELR